ncbi:MAG: putative viral replication protein [Cressdnaviricota sp.]|nr:MAG: putative viral replication protein [Cressdnaviricota sp.]
MTNEQKRHWVSTVWPGHMGYEATDDEAELIDAYEAFWRNLADAPGLKYGIAQIERSPDTGQLHIQAYTEWAQSKRLKEVYKILPSDLDFRRGSRDVARDYCRKTDSRVKVLPELGEWRKEKAAAISPKQRALSYLRDGFSPARICSMDPECYFTHWRSINAVYHSLMMKPLLTSDDSLEHGKKEILCDEEEE